MTDESPFTPIMLKLRLQHEDPGHAKQVELRVYWARGAGPTKSWKPVFFQLYDREKLVDESVHPVFYVSEPGAYLATAISDDGFSSTTQPLEVTAGMITAVRVPDRYTLVVSPEQLRSGAARRLKVSVCAHQPILQDVQSYALIEVRDDLGSPWMQVAVTPTKTPHFFIEAPGAYFAQVYFTKGSSETTPQVTITPEMFHS